MNNIKKPLLTVAIPAYNVDKFIKNTILSILRASNSELVEILVIDDGSKDKTKEEVESLKEKYSNIKLISKTNGGHGSAINTGIDNATGKYFRLLDGDDWFETKELENFLKILENENVDLVLSDFTEQFIKSDNSNPVTFYTELKEFKEYKLSDIAFSSWGPMLPTTTIKTSLLRKFGLKIDEHCYYVDQEYNLACYLSAKTVKYYPFFVYNYRLEREGQSMEKSSLIRNVYSHEKVCIRLIEEYEKYKNTLSEIQKSYLTNRVIIPMCNMQYMIIEQWCSSREAFLSFDSKLKKFANFYKNKSIAGNITGFYRSTGALLIKRDIFMRNIFNIFRIISSKKAFLLKSLAIIIPIVISNIIIVNYIKSEKAIYFWDISAYWKNSINILDVFENSFYDGVKETVKSLSSDYNYLPIIPILPLMKIFGTSRLFFILSIFNLYVIPFGIIMLLIMKKIVTSFTNINITSFSTALSLSAILVFPQTLIPILEGRPDAISLIFVSLIFYLLVKTRMECISNYVMLGFLIVPIIVLRRYFVFWVIGFLVALWIILAIKHFINFGLTKKTISKIIKLTIKFLITLSITGIIMLVVFKPLFMRYITPNYSDQYSAYLLGGFLNQIKLFIEYYGLILLGVILFSFLLLIKVIRDNFLRLFLVMLPISGFISFILFTRVQTLGTQHMYIFIPMFSIISSTAIMYLSSKNKISKLLGVILYVTILILSINSFTGERSIAKNHSINIVWGISKNVRPIVRKDIEELRKIDSDLKGIMKNNDYLYILSSSELINDDLLANINLPKPPTYNISGVKHIDKRDGFPSYFFDANYILVADPIQTHVTEDGQRVITVLASKILEGEAHNLEHIKTYNIDNNIKLKLFKKIEKYDTNFLKEIKSIFKYYYEDYDFLWKNIPEEN